MADVSMRILLAVVGSSAVNSAIRAVGGEISNLSPGMGIAAGAALGVSAAVVGIGAAAVGMASDFQSSLAKVQAYAGMTAQETQDMGQQILALAPQLGEAPKALADALYMVSSAGFKGAQGLQVLREAGMTAAASNSDATVVTKALVGSLNALGLGANQSGNIMDVLNATVSQGLMTWDNYGAVIGKISGAVSVAGGSASMMQSNFVQLNSALDVYTNASVSARQASMYLQADMSLLDGKTSTLAKNAAKLGVSFNESQFKSMSFAQQLQYLNKVTDGNHDKLVALLGGNSQVANSVQFLNNHYGTLSQTIANVSGSMKNGQTTQDKFAVAQQTLAFKSQQASAAFQSLMIVLGNALLPAITKIVTWVTNGITAFTNWTTHSQTLHVVLDALGKGFSVLGSWVSKVADFFQHNAAAMTALKVVGVAFLGAFLGLVIAGFIALAIAAWSAAIGVLAVTWPFLLIGAAIALVIAGIVLLIQHWSQVVAFLQGVWNAVATWFMNSLHSVGQFFTNIWTGIASFFSSIWNDIISGLQSAWNWIVGIVQAGLAALWNIVTKPFRDIGALFTWLYNHNYYIKALVDAITGFFKGLFSWATGAWNNFTGWLGGLWNGLKNTASSAWGAVSSTVGGWVNNATNATKSAWGTATNWLGDRWGQLQKAAGIAWAAVSKVFGGIWQNYIAKPLGDLWKSISDWFGGLAKSAIDWGKNLIQGFINGVKNMIGNLGQALGNVGHNIASFLGFHSPTKEGPGREADQWAPNLIKMYAKGLQSALPQLQTSLALVMRPVGATLSGQVPVPGGIGTPTRTTQIGSTGHTFNISISTMARSQSEVSRLVDMVEAEIGRRFRGQTSGYSAGGVF